MINTEIWIIICLLILFLKYAVIVPQQDKSLYKMYEARDKVAGMAVRREISQDSDEYEFVMKKMQQEIYYCKHDYNFTILLKNIFLKPLRNNKHFDNILENIGENDVLKQACITSYHEFIRKMNWRLKAFTMFVLIPISVALKMTLITLEIVEKMFSIGNTAVRIVTIAEDKMRFLSKDCIKYLQTNPYRI